MRLIDADLLEDQFGISDEDLLALDEIRHAPTVDAVAVVRCKGCKHYRNHPNGLCYLHTEPKENKRRYSGEPVCVEPDDFCSYGEPKKGENADNYD